MRIGIDASRAVVARPTGTEHYSVQVIRGLVEAGPEHRFRLYLREPAPPGLLPEAPQVEHIVLGPRRLCALNKLVIGQTCSLLGGLHLCTQQTVVKGECALGLLINEAAQSICRTG